MFVVRFQKEAKRFAEHVPSGQTIIHHLKAKHWYSQGKEHGPLPQRMDVDAEPKCSGENHHGQPVLHYSPPARVHV